MAQKVAERLKDHVREKEIPPERRVFPITDTAGRAMVKKAGKLVEINLKPHDLRRHAATYASRFGTPIEIVSKMILKRANLSTTQGIWGRSAILKP
jgi:integrase/recombinase XerD